VPEQDNAELLQLMETANSILDEQFPDYSVSQMQAEFNPIMEAIAARQRHFGIWGLPDPQAQSIEQRLKMDYMLAEKRMEQSDSKRNAKLNLAFKLHDMKLANKEAELNEKKSNAELDWRKAQIDSQEASDKIAREDADRRAAEHLKTLDKLDLELGSLRYERDHRDEITKSLLDKNFADEIASYYQGIESQARTRALDVEADTATLTQAADVDKAKATSAREVTLAKKEEFEKRAFDKTIENFLSMGFDPSEAYLAAKSSDALAGQGKFVSPFETDVMRQTGYQAGEQSLIQSGLGSENESPVPFTEWERVNRFREAMQQKSYQGQPMSFAPEVNYPPSRYTDFFNLGPPATQRPAWMDRIFGRARGGM
jgi:hypothetical protein